jgi:hypothetical protein
VVRSNVVGEQHRPAIDLGGGPLLGEEAHKEAKPQNLGAYRRRWAPSKRPIFFESKPLCHVELAAKAGSPII